MNLNHAFFQKHQKALLGIANAKYLRWMLGLHSLPWELKRDFSQIHRVTPNSVHTRLQNGKWKAAFFIDNRFQNALQTNLDPFFYFVKHPRLTRFRFSLAGVLGGFTAFASKGLLLAATTTQFFTDATDTTLDVSASATFAAAHDAASAGSASTTDPGGVNCYKRTVDSLFYMQRLFSKIDTSALTAAAVISSATLSEFATASATNVSAPGFWAYGPYASTSADTPTTSDWGNCGTTIWATAIPDNTAVSAYWVWTLNATGLAAISLTGTTKFSLREANFDAPNSAPGLNNAGANNTNGGASFSLSSHAGTSQDPYLEVVYTLPGGATDPIKKVWGGGVSGGGVMGW